MQIWKIQVFERDNWTCRWENCKERKNLEAHHLVKSFRLLCFAANISSMEQALQDSELWDVVNGVTLCRKHHKMTDDYGNVRQ